MNQIKRIVTKCVGIVKSIKLSIKSSINRIKYDTKPVVKKID